MEHLIVDSKEHKLLRKFKKKLEQRYNVEIRMPSASSFDSDVIFVSIHGEKSNRDCVKNFLSEKKQKNSQNAVNEGVVIITLSDSEEEQSSTDSEEVDIIETTYTGSSPNSGNKFDFKNSQNNSVCIIDVSSPKEKISAVSDHQTKRKKKRPYKKPVQEDKVRPKAVLPSSDADSIELFTSSVDDMVRKKAKMNDSVIILEDSIITIDENCSVQQESKSSQKDTLESSPAIIPDFIPLIKMPKSQNKMKEDGKKCSHFNSSIQKKVDTNDAIVIIDEPQLTPRSLRPIVIDGSNVAREHGKVSATFSAKGIQIAIDYFLKRGHTQVTAFVPRFRRGSTTKSKIPTTDPSILDELEKKQQVVFTPSRRLPNGVKIASHDDRFIVQLAASNGGVIVSNDNYRDLIDIDPSFKEAIEKRLLMFCFVGDVFMVPDDPLGRNGPKLNEFLTFPPEKDES